jgi:hypothetical protein
MHQLYGYIGSSSEQLVATIDARQLYAGYSGFIARIGSLFRVPLGAYWQDQDNGRIK